MSRAHKKPVPFLSALVCLMGIAGSPSSVQATLYVDASAAGGDLGNLCTVNTAPCQTIGYALTKVTPNNTIELLGTTPFQESNLLISSTWDIRGTSAINRAVIDAGLKGRHFDVGGVGTTARFKNLRMINGNAPVGGDGGSIRILPNVGLVDIRNCSIDGNAADFGGAIAIQGSGMVNIQDSDLLNNTATFDGGAISQQGASTLSIEASSLNTNTASSAGGAIACSQCGGSIDITESNLSGNAAASHGGAIYSAGTGSTDILLTELTNNTTNNGNGGAIYLGVAGGNRLNVQRSTFDQNVTANGGGGIHAEGGGISISNSTFSANQALVGGGLDILATVNSADVYSSTFYGNIATFGLAPGGGALANNINNLRLNNSILAGSVGDECAGTLLPVVIDSLIDDATCGPVANPVSDFDTSLANNGGPTNTHTILSPASNAVDAVVACVKPNGLALNFDQRNTARPLGGACDIGAVEAY